MTYKDEAGRDTDPRFEPFFGGRYQLVGFGQKRQTGMHGPLSIVFMPLGVYKERAEG